MSKSVKEIRKEIEADVKISSKGKPIKTFSRGGFDQMMKAILNDQEHTVEVAKMSDGKMVTESISPAKEFRNGFLKKVLQDAGLDKAEAAKQAEEQEITNVGGFYEVISEGIFQFIDSGKKFLFLPKENFKGSLVLDDIGTTVKDHRRIQDGSTITVETKAHKKLKVKGAGAPNWLKKRKK